jgi:hypothetical protein
MGTPALRLSGARKTYGGTAVLDGIDLGSACPAEGCRAGYGRAAGAPDQGAIRARGTYSRAQVSAVAAKPART